MATRGNPHFGDEVMDATRQILNIGSAAIDVAMLTAEVGREVPIASAALEAFIAIHDVVETVRANKEDLEGLRDRCRYLTACVVEECRRRSLVINLTPLEDILHETADVIKRCGGRKGMMQVLKATSDKNEIQSLNVRLNQVGIDMGLAGTIRTLTLIHQDKLQSNKGPAPQGVPIRKGWYVDRHQIVRDVYDRLCGEESPKLVALVGESGSGKTTVAAEIARDSRVQDFFSDGIVWLSVDNDASDRLPSLMARLAGMINKNMSRAVREDMINSRSGAEYIKQRMDQGRQGKGLTYLVVADNVWEPEVVRELRKTGMWILVTTRDHKVLESSANDPAGTVKVGEMVGDEDDHAGTVEVGEMFGDAELVLKRSAELTDNVWLPDAAEEVVELCGRMAMELAFVGSWDLVYQRRDSYAWQDAVKTITTELQEVSGRDCSAIPSDLTREVRRRAILLAGFKELDKLQQTLYMSLAVMPDGHAFTVDNAAILLYGHEYSGNDKTAAKQAVENLERWSVLGSYDGVYKMHDFHAAKARNKLENNKEVLDLALARTKRGAQYHALEINISRCAEDLVALAIAISDFKPDASGEVVGLLRHALERLSNDNSQVATVMDHLGICIGNAGRYDEAVGMLRKALKIEKAKSGEDVLQVAITLQSLGVCFRDSRRYDEAEDILRKALAIEKAKLGEDDLQVAITLHDLGVCLCDNGRYDEAEDMLRKALKIRRAKLGEDDLQVAATLNELSKCLRNNGRYDKVEEMLKNALTIEKAKLGEDDLQVAITLQSLGACLRDSGRYDEAEAVLNQALASQKTKLGEDDLEVAYTLYCLGICIMDSGRPEEAEPLLRQDLKISATKKADDDIEISASQIQLAVCLREMGKLVEADKLFELSSERIETRHENNESRDAALVRLRLGLYAWRSGMQERAARLLRRALSVTDATDLEKDVRVVAERLHKYSVIRGIKLLKEEADGLLSCVLGIDLLRAREGWLAGQNASNIMPTE